METSEVVVTLFCFAFMVIVVGAVIGYFVSALKE